MESWSKSGRDEHAQGEAEYNAAQAKGYAEGAVDRLTGKKDAVVGALTGDRQQELEGKSAQSSHASHTQPFDPLLTLTSVFFSAVGAGNVRHDKGQAQQNLNDPSS